MKTLPILDERATGIDVGSESLHVSIGGDASKVYGTMTRDLEALVAWLKAEGVRSVAVEATGVYWLCLYEALETAAIQVLVVNGWHVRNLPGRKTDMADCQWLATLHAHGLLRSGFVPEAAAASTGIGWIDRVALHPGGCGNCCARNWPSLSVGW